MKTILKIALIISTLIATGCTTPVAVDPQSGQEQTAKFQMGNFYAPLDADIKEVFRVAIRVLDDSGYYRTGELHKDNAITIYARKVGDEKVTLRSYYKSNRDESAIDGTSMLSIRIGKLGNLPESQTIYARIRDAL